MMKLYDSISVTVIVITLHRPDCLRICLQALKKQSCLPSQIIVTDSSQDDRSRFVTTEFPDVLYLPVPHLFGRMTASRNVALAHAIGEIIVFIDDDSYAHREWLQNLVAAYDSDDIGAVGGRALNNQPNETYTGRDQIGQLKNNGFLTGNFAADPGRPIDVDHIIGCNMSFRRELLARLGGFREDFRGISGLCEDTDICFRAKALGYRIRFEPSACVDHVGAPQASGRRFNVRYQYFHRRNSFILLIRNFGFCSMTCRFPFAIAMQTARECLRNIGSAIGRVFASIFGLLAGLIQGILIRNQKGRDPIRRDAAAQALRTTLQAGKTQTIRTAESPLHSGN